MSKRLLKKIILGSVLTSVAVSSTAIFSINASKQNFANQNNNTSSFKDLYTQKGEPSTASVNKLNPTPNALTNKANSNKWNQQMTPYASIVKKPVITFVGFKEPSSPTAADGEAYYEIKNYEPTYMFWSLFTKNTTHSDTFKRSTMGHRDTSATVKNLKYGDNFKFYFYPKKGYVWNDGTTNIVEDSSFRLIGKQVKKPTIHYLGFKAPSSPTAADGEAYYNVEYFNSNMEWDIWPSKNINSDMTSRIKMHYIREKVTFSNVKLGDDWLLMISPKKGYVWDDGTNTTVDDTNNVFIYKDPNTVKKPKITQVTKKPTTTTSTDGEITYTLTNFDPKIMKISLAHGSKGILGTFNSSNNTIKVTGLKNGQKAQIKVEFKKSGTSSLPRNFLGKLSGFGVEDDNTTQPKMHPKNFVSRTTITLPKNNALEFETILDASNFDNGINPTFEAIKRDSTYGLFIFGFLIFDKSSQKITYNGKSIEGASNAMEWTLDSENVSGNHSQIKYQIWVEHFNKTSREISLATKLWLSIDGTGEDAGIVNDISFKLFSNLPPIWEDQSTKPIYSTPWTASQTYVGLQKPTFTKMVKKQPTTTTSVDGEVTYTLTNFDPSKMIITLAPGSSGTLGTYDPTTKQVKVTGLEVTRSYAQIQVTPKTIESWINGTRTPHKSATFTPVQTYVGFTKTIFTHIVKQPTTTTSVDGEVSFTLIHFDQTKMSITLAPGSSGTLGTFNPKNSTIKVTHLSSGQHAQIQTTPIKSSTWKDGTQVPHLSSKATLQQTYTGLKKPKFTNVVTQPQTTTSIDGEVTFTLTHFDPTNMSLSTTPGSSGTLGTFNPKNSTIKVTHLSSGQHAQIQVTLKQNNTWTDGTVVVVNSHSVNLSTTVLGLKKPTFTHIVKQPTTTTSVDGEVSFTLIHFDQTKMSITLAPGSSGTLGTFNPKNSTIKVTHLSSGQHAQIQVTLKKNNIWLDGKSTIVKSRSLTINQTYTGLKKPTFTHIVKQPTTTTSTDGEVIFTIVYYNPSRMQMSLSPGSSGTLGTFNSNNNKIKVTHLSSGQNTQIQIKLKRNNTWTDGTNVAISSPSLKLLQTNTGLKKPTFTHIVKQPTTTTSTDGEATFTLLDFDITKMYISLAFGSSGSLGKFNSKTKTIKVTHLSSGQHAQIQVTLKKNNIWLDGKSTIVKSPSLTINQTNTGLKKPTFTHIVKQPTTTTSVDGEVSFTLIHFDQTKMSIALAPSSNGTLGTYDPTTKQIKVTGVAVGQHAQIQITPKANNFWSDATTMPQISSVFKPSQTFVGLTKTTFSHIIKQPTTKTSKDGEVTFTLTNFNPQIMNLSVAAGSNGHLASFDSKSKSIKVKLLSSGQHAQIQVTLKANDIWADGSILPIKSKLVGISQKHLGVNIPKIKHELIQPTTTTSTDGQVTFKLTSFNAAKMDISLAPGSGGTIGAFDSKTNTIKVINLTHGQNAQIQFVLKPQLIWEDGKTTPYKSFKIRINHNDSWLKKVVISSIISKPTTKKSRDGKVIFKLKNFQPSKMSVDFVKGSDGFIGTYEPTNETLEVLGLANSENAQVEVSLKRNQYWLDGTNESVKSKKITIVENGIKNIKIIKKEFIQPTSTKTGTIILTLEKYDVDNIIAKIIGSHGSIGAYNEKTKQIKITGLKKNAKVEFEFSLKSKNSKTGLKNWWENGTDDPEKDVLFMGYKKNLFKNIELSNPTKTNPKDFQVIFELSDFDPITMEAELSDLSSGVLGKYDAKNKKIQVSKLNAGETAQIKIFFKDKTLIWSDGSSQQIESEKLKIPNSYAKSTSISSSNEGMSKLLLAGIIIGALIVVNIGWIGMYKIMKSRRDF